MLRVDQNVKLGGDFLDDVSLRRAEKNLRPLREQVHGPHITGKRLFLVVKLRLLFAELHRPRGLILLRPGGKTPEGSAEIIGQPLENQLSGGIEQIAVRAVLFQQRQRQPSRGLGPVAAAVVPHVPDQPVHQLIRPVSAPTAAHGNLDAPFSFQQAIGDAYGQLVYIHHHIADDAQHVRLGGVHRGQGKMIVRMVAQIHKSAACGPEIIQGQVRALEQENDIPIEPQGV